MLIFCDPPTCRAQAGRPSASWRQAHPNVALGDRAWPRVIVPCKDWPSATAYGGCGLDKGLSPGPRLPPRDRWRRPFARANGGSANLSTPGSIPMSVEGMRFCRSAEGHFLSLRSPAGRPSRWRALRERISAPTNPRPVRCCWRVIPAWGCGLERTGAGSLDPRVVPPAMVIIGSQCWRHTMIVP